MYVIYIYIYMFFVLCFSLQYRRNYFYLPLGEIFSFLVS